MKIDKIEITNYRSIQHLIIEPAYLCALVGENNSGKSNILQAINLMLGELWPSVRQIDDSDIYNKDVNRNIEIKLIFDSGTSYTDATGRAFDIRGFSLTYTHYKRKAGMHSKGDHKIEFICLDASGNEIKVIRKLPVKGSGQRPVPETLYVNSELRDMFPVVFINVNRDLKYHLSGSQWTLFGKLLKEVESSFLSDEARKAEYLKKMAEISNLLRIPIFEEMEKKIEENVKKQTGYKQAKLSFKEPSILAHYKNLELNVKESDSFAEAPALEMGSGIQSAIVIALIQAYKDLQKSGGVLMIEETEVYLHPHTRRFFCNLLKSLADSGNQIFYTTHSVEFLDLSDYQTVTVIRKTSSDGTKAFQPHTLSIELGTKKELKLLTEFDARRNELFFARKVLIVEGQTEKYSLPFAFKLIGIDINEQGISIVDVGGKDNIQFFVEILRAFKIPFVVFHDEDRGANNYTTHHAGESGLNKKIENAVGDEGTVFKADPDFEGIFGLTGHDKIKEARNKIMTITDKSMLPKVILDCLCCFSQ